MQYACVYVYISSQHTFLKVTRLFIAFYYLEFDMLVPPSNSSEYVVFHAISCIPRVPQKNYIGRVPPKFSPHFLSFRIRRRDRRLLRARRSFAARRGAANSVSHEFREATRIDVEPLHIGRRFPTLRQYGQVPPVILRLFAPRRVAALYVGTYICRRQAALTEYRDRTRLKCKKRPRGIPVVALDFRARPPAANRSLVIAIFRDCC